MSAGSADSLDELRQVIKRGFQFSEKDLTKLLAGDGSEESLKFAEDTLRVVRAGVSFDQDDIPDLMNDGTFAQFEQARGWSRTAWSLKWVVFIPSLVVLIGIAFTGGDEWRSRSLWAGSVLGGTAALFFVSLTVSWGLIPSEVLPKTDFDIFSDDQLARFPHFTTLIRYGELTELTRQVIGAYVSGLAKSALPWVLVGFAVTGLAWTFPKYRQFLSDSLRPNLPSVVSAGSKDGHQGSGEQAVPAADVPLTSSSRGSELAPPDRQ